MAKAPKNREVDELGPNDAAWLLDTTLEDKKLMQLGPNRGIGGQPGSGMICASGVAAISAAIFSR
jgi:hypothetical protein